MSYALYEASSLSAERAQPTNEYSWSGRENDTVAIQMTAPVTARANVTPSETSDGQFPDGIAVFFDGAGQLGDFGNRLDSTAQFDSESSPPPTTSSSPRTLSWGATLHDSSLPCPSSRRSPQERSSCGPYPSRRSSSGKS